MTGQPLLLIALTLILLTYCRHTCENIRRFVLLCAFRYVPTAAAGFPRVHSKLNAAVPPKNKKTQTMITAAAFVIDSENVIC